MDQCNIIVERLHLKEIWIQDTGLASYGYL